MCINNKIVFLLFAFLSVKVNSFPTDDHEEITKTAIFKIAANTLKIDDSITYTSTIHLFQIAFGTVPTLIHGGGFDLPPADRRTPSTKPFETFILDVTRNYYDMELKKEIDPAFFWDVLDVSVTFKILQTELKNAKKYISTNNFDALKLTTARILLLIQNFYTYTNWLELGNRYAPDFLLDSSANINNIKSLGVAGGSDNDKEDPSSPLYEVAKYFAEVSTINYFCWIRDQMKDIEKFKLFLGIKSGKTIAFNIDDTGSMTPYIDASKKHAQAIADAYSTSQNPPSRYIIQTFNDPTVGETVITQDLLEVKTTLGKIVANGGGDLPELALTGLTKILDHLEDRSYSEIFFYTDAPAKDLDLLDEVRAKIQKKLPRITFLLAYIPLHLPYEVIAAESGGDILKVDRTNVLDTVSFLVSRASISAENVIGFENMLISKVFDFYVDATASAANIHITNLNTINKITLYNPSGAVIVPLVPITSNTLTVLQIDAPVAGKWQLSIELKETLKIPYNVKISFETATSFYIKIVDYIDEDYGAGVELDGSLIIGSEVGVIVDLLGFPSENFPIIERIELLRPDGKLLTSTSITQHKSSPRFYEYIRVPSEAFQFKIYGVSKVGKKYERLHNQVFKVTNAKFDIYLYSIRNNVYTLNYKLFNGLTSAVNVMIKVNLTAHFKMHKFYEQIKFSIGKYQEYSDIIVMDRLTSPDVLAGSIKIELFNAVTNEILDTKLVDMDGVPLSLS